MTGVTTKEVEFEFVEGQEAGRFQATEKVRGVILRYLMVGDIDAATTLIASSPPELGDALLREDAKEASVAVRASLAEVFVRARDYERAGRAALLTGDPGKAAPFFERSYQFEKAAELYEQAGQLEHAAELYARTLAYEKAALLYEKAGRAEDAAEQYCRAGSLFKAGRLWSKVRRFDKAVETLQKVDEKNPEYGYAVYMLGRIFEHTGHQDQAVLRYTQLVRARPLDETTVDVFERLGELFSQSRHVRAARKLLISVLTFDPSRKKAQTILASLPPDEGSSVEPGARGSRLPDDHSSGHMSVARITGVGALPPLGPLPTFTTMTSQQPVIEEAPSSAHVSVLHKEIDTLRQLPLFAELLLGELRELYDLSERVSFKGGDLMIEQDREASSIFVVLTGTVTVVHVDGSDERPLIEFGYGASLGEMALVDEGPTSARVRALTDVTALRWPMTRFRRYLDAHEATALRILRVVSRTLSVRLRETNRRVGR